LNRGLFFRRKRMPGSEELCDQPARFCGHVVLVRGLNKIIYWVLVVVFGCELLLLVLWAVAGSIGLGLTGLGRQPVVPFLVVGLHLALGVVTTGLVVKQRKAEQDKEDLMRKLERQKNHDILLVAESNRHCFMNHIQVLSGWLQLNRPERARQYLERVREGIRREARMVRMVTADLAAVLLTEQTYAESRGIPFCIEVTGPVGELGASFEFVPVLFSAMLRGFTTYVESQGKTGKITVRIWQDEGGLSVFDIEVSGVKIPRERWEEKAFRERAFRFVRTQPGAFLRQPGVDFVYQAFETGTSTSLKIRVRHRENRREEEHQGETEAAAAREPAGDRG